MDKININLYGGKSFLGGREEPLEADGKLIVSLEGKKENKDIQAEQKNIMNLELNIEKMKFITN